LHGIRGSGVLLSHGEIGSEAVNERKGMFVQERREKNTLSRETLIPGS